MAYGELRYLSTAEQYRHTLPQYTRAMQCPVLTYRTWGVLLSAYARALSEVWY